MPKPEFGLDDYENPDAPMDERRLRSDHPLVRDLSYDASRSRQEMDLWKGALVADAMEPWKGRDDLAELPPDTEPKPELRLFIKERSRGPGYVCDFVYRARDLPVTVYGIFVNHGQGLAITELELWRGGRARSWGYWDPWDVFVDADGWAESRRREQLEHQAFLKKESAHGREYPPDPPPRAFVAITSDLLRSIPLGTIVARAQAELADREWESEGVRMIPGGKVPAHELPAGTHNALDNATRLAQRSPRGRPPVADELLAEVASAYIQEASAGPGLTRRLSLRFDRPEPTIKDWIKLARRRGFLSEATPGRRGASPGTRMSMPSRPGPVVP
jgi:hypothetical protein